MALALTLTGAHSASATVPGQNGLIAFVRSGDIWAINADGTGKQQITTNPANDWGPAWSPDGARLAFVREVPFVPFGSTQSDIFVIDPAGGAPINLTNTGLDHEAGPAWSPDGKQILFWRFGESAGLEHLFVMDADGTNERLLTRGFAGAWSPDGKTIAFTRTDTEGEWIVLIAPDGSGERLLPIADFPGPRVYPPDRDNQPSWAPAGNRVVFTAYRETQFSGLVTMGIDGSNPLGFRQDAWVASPSWSPDGKLIAYSRGNPVTQRSDIWVYTPTGAASFQVTTDPAGSGDPDWQPLKQLNPAPVLSSLSPTSVAQGADGFTLVVNGSKFVASSRVRLNGEDRPTTFVSATRLLAEIAASDLNTAGEARVTVASPAPGGGVSGSRILTITGPSPIAPPRSLTEPVIAGSPRVGELLTCSIGTWSNTPSAFSFAWLRAGSPIPGATGPSRQVALSDAGKALACRVDASNAGGTSSAVSAEVLVAGELPATAAPVAVGAVPPLVNPTAGGATGPSLRKTGLIGIGVPSSGRVGSLLRFKATFRGIPGGRVVLQRRAGRKFVNVSSVRARSLRVTLTFRPRTAGLLAFRLRYLSAGKQRLSRTILVRVRPRTA